MGHDVECGRSGRPSLGISEITFSYLSAQAEQIGGSIAPSRHHQMEGAAMTDFSIASLSCEDRLLLLCAHVTLTPAQEQQLQELVLEPIDWESLVRRAVAHRIHTFVYHHLHRLGAHSHVPPDVWKSLDANRAGTMAKSLARHLESKRILCALSSAGVDVIPLKGLALRGSVYPASTFRFSRDLDLLVRLAAVEQAAHALEDLGYVPLEHHELPDRYGPDVHHHLVPYFHPQLGVVVEIHWALASPRAAIQVDVGGLWQRSTPGQVAGCSVRLLAPEDMLLHLGLHTSLSERFFGGLRHLMDISEMVTRFRGEIDWASLAMRAAEWGGAPFIYLTLRVADDLLEIGNMDDVLAAMRPAQFDDALVAAARQRVLALVVSRRPDVTESKARFLMDGSANNRLHLLRWILFPSRERMADMYDLPVTSPWLLGCYLLRPFQLLHRHARLLLGLARKDENAGVSATDRQQQLLLDRLLRPRHFPLSEEGTGSELL